MINELFMPRICGYLIVHTNGTLILEKDKGERRCVR
jgi:hypothetical protein